MVINIRLSDRTTAANDDPLGRTWYGYDPSASPEELWRNNRGDWRLDAGRVAGERWAALIYRGAVVVVAELDSNGHETVPIPGQKPKKALVGRVLGPGDPIHEALFGTIVEYPAGSRNSLLYGPDPARSQLDTRDPAQEPDLPHTQGQGIQMDPEMRKAIEDAAQNRLMESYRQRGWDVTDTRLGNPYDAVAVKGSEVIYLEAKGTQSRGETVIVTRNEVLHARQHPGQCRIGVWSGMAFTPDGKVDPDAGVFTELPFAPNDQDLQARDFDWTLPRSGP